MGSTDYREKVLQLVRFRPQLPSAIAKSLGVSTIIAGAMLSEMASKKVLRISNLKIGSSPLYYLPQNEALLEEFKDNLDEKSLHAFDLLKEKRVLRDREQSPLVRVCLKQMKDFAKPLEVIYGGNTELFYKYFTLSDEQARDDIAKLLNPEDLAQRAASLRDSVAQQIPQIPLAKVAEVKQSVQVQEVPPAQVASVQEQVRAMPMRKSVSKQKEIPQDAVHQQQSQNADTPKKRVVIDEQQPLTMETLGDDTLVANVAKYCKENKIGILWYDVKRKGAEAHFELTIPSAVGRISFFACAKSKKKVTDADLSSAYVIGQLRKLPVVFLSSGELTSKGQELLKDLKGLTFTSL